LGGAGVGTGLTVGNWGPLGPLGRPSVLASKVGGRASFALGVMPLAIVLAEALAGVCAGTSSCDMGADTGLGVGGGSSLGRPFALALAGEAGKGGDGALLLVLGVCAVVKATGLVIGSASTT
jgi:hypothetical protein